MTGGLAWPVMTELGPSSGWRVAWSTAINTFAKNPANGAARITALAHAHKDRCGYGVK
jgi:hypothetical protein